MYTIDGTVLYKDRIIVPVSLIEGILNIRHSAHQGVGPMLSPFTNNVGSFLAWHYSSSPSPLKLLHWLPQKCTFTSQCTTLLCSDTRLPLLMHLWRCFQLSRCLVPCCCGLIFQLAHNQKGTLWIEKVHCLSLTIICNLWHPRWICFRRWTRVHSWYIFYFPAELGSQPLPIFSCFPTLKDRAEVAVKTDRRLITSNTGSNARLDIYAFQRAILQYCNTPDPQTRL